MSGDVVIAGEPAARVRAALSTGDGNLVVRLHDIAPDGTSFVITTGWLRASHRLRLSVSSGDLSAVEPNAPPGTVTVLAGSGGSTVEVPVRPG
jgi:predicted acyl esterase